MKNIGQIMPEHKRFVLMLDYREEKISISFAPDLIPLILNGSKTLTYRLGDKYTLFKHRGYRHYPW